MRLIVAKRQLNNLDQHQESLPSETNRKAHIYTKSEFFRRSLDYRTIMALADNLARDTASVRSREVAFMPWGGAYNQVLFLARIVRTTRMNWRIGLQPSATCRQLPMCAPWCTTRPRWADWRTVTRLPALRRS